MVGLGVNGATGLLSGLDVGSPKNAEAHFKDNVHPSDDAGRKLIADTVVAAILKKYK